MEMTAEEYELLHDTNEAISSKDALLDPYLRSLLTDIEQSELASELLTFQNAHHVAYNVAMKDPSIGRALLEELLHWKQTGRL